MAKKTKSKKKPSPRKKTSSSTTKGRASASAGSSRTSSRTRTAANTTTGRKKTTKGSGGGTSARGAKKTPAKTPAKTTAKTPAKKTPIKKTTARTTAPKKTTTKKTTAGKPTASKPAAKKPAAKPTPTNKKAPAKTAAVTTTTKTTTAVGKKKTTRKRSGRGRSLGARSVAEAASAGEADAQGYVYVNGRRVRMISTGGQGITKKTRTRRAAEEETVVEAPKKPIKTNLTSKQLRHYKGLLLVKRAELVGDVNSMESAALQPGGGSMSNLPIHMADIGSDTFEQDFMLGLAEKERTRLVEIDAALARIADKTYGVCQMTGEEIPTARLDAKPWAKYTIESARIVEGQWRP